MIFGNERFDSDSLGDVGCYEAREWRHCRLHWPTSLACIIRSKNDAVFGLLPNVAVSVIFVNRKTFKEKVSHHRHMPVRVVNLGLNRQPERKESARPLLATGLQVERRDLALLIALRGIACEFERLRVDHLESLLDGCSVFRRRVLDNFELQVSGV